MCAARFERGDDVALMQEITTLNGSRYDAVRRHLKPLLALWALIAITRLFAISATPWDWDEADFLLGMRDYDMSLHHPHPPGFPAFIALAHVVRPFVPSDFAALQAVAVTGAILLAPLLVYLGLEIGFTLATSVAAATLLSFIPPVWIFGGTGFSDVPSLALMVGGAAALLHGRRSPRAYVIGAIVAGVAGGFRIQAALLIAAPYALAFWCHLRRRRFALAVAAPLLSAAIVVAFYAGSVIATGAGFDAWLDVVRVHGDYIRTVDSFRNPERPPIVDLLDDVYIRYAASGSMDYLLALLALIGIGGAVAKIQSRAVGWTLLLFFPFTILTLTSLDPYSFKRFSIAYAPMFALLAAAGLAVAARAVGEEWRSRFIGAGAALIALSSVVRTAQPITRLHEPSPPVAAFRQLLAERSPDDPVYLSGGLIPHGDLFIGRGEFEVVADDARVPDEVERGFYVMEGEAIGPGTQVFRRTRERLEKMVRRRYFEISLIRLHDEIRFLEGWYGEESSRDEHWRWMGRRGELSLPPLDAGEGQLRLRIEAPIAELKAPPSIEFSVGGRVVYRIEAMTSARDVTIDLPATTRQTLVVSTSDALPAGTGGDPRELGLRLDAFEWSAPDG